jgi:hypothetical protein
MTNYRVPSATLKINGETMINKLYNDPLTTDNDSIKKDGDAPVICELYLPISLFNNCL